MPPFAMPIVRRQGGRAARLTAMEGSARYRPMVDPRDAAQRIERLTPLAEAESCIDRLAGPVAPRNVEAHAACGRILAADIAAAGAHPAVAFALRDGFAVVGGATLG